MDGNFESIKLPVPLQNQLWTDFTDLGADPEQYRAPFEIRHNERADDFSSLIRLCRTMSLPQAQFDAQISAAMDVDEVLRLAALIRLCGIEDTYYTPGSPNEHNLRLFAASNGAPAQFLPWDMDMVFYNSTSSSIYPEPSRNLYKLIKSPATKRIYLGHINDLCLNVFNTTYMTAWLTHYGSVVGQDFSAGSGYIQSRRSYALSQLPTAQPFAITSNQGQDFVTSATNVIISGTGWLDVHQISLLGNTNPLALSWTSVTEWQVTLSLPYGTNALAFVAYDRNNNPLATNRINVVRADLPLIVLSSPLVSPASIPAGVGLILQASVARGSNIFWSSVSGPGTVTFGSANSSNTTASFSTNGAYLLRCSAVSGPFTTSADIMVNVLTEPTPWVGQMVGAGSAGTHTLTNGVFQILAAGAGLPSGGVPDNFYFIAKTMDGDAEVKARIVSVENINGSNSRAGVIIRESLAGDARQVFVGENSLAGAVLFIGPVPGESIPQPPARGAFRFGSNSLAREIFSRRLRLPTPEELLAPGRFWAPKQS